MLPHFGQEWISPIALASRTLSRARHVSQVTRKGSTEQLQPDPGEAAFEWRRLSYRSYSEFIGGLIA
jgi:hypothetical protein